MNLDDLLDSDDILGDLAKADDDALAEVIGGSRNNRMLSPRRSRKKKKGKTSSVSASKKKKKAASKAPSVEELTQEQALARLKELGIDINLNTDKGE